MGVDLHDPVVRAAIALSHLAAVPEPLLAPLLADAMRLGVPAGSFVRREGERGPHIEVVISGLVRVYVSSPDGRTLTVRYCRRGAMIGAVSLFRPSYVMPGGLQAIVDTDLLVLRADAVRTVSDRERAMADALIAELSERAYQFVTELPGASFASVRQRVARHLLDIAADQQQGPLLVAPVSQQAMADAVGSVREVVVRALGDLRRDGLVATGGGEIRILDPDRLAAEVFAPPVTEVPRSADLGR
ncbi:MAG TPA: Crp/Fnr family transcriptional regulator [Candidatus Limnocylindrales bacterium]|jgi:CRP/FNR family transcriptional regulator